jgi:hypothetical protein
MTLTVTTTATTTAPTTPAVPGRRLASALGLRLAAFAAFQALVALLLAAGGSPHPWTESAAWWPLTATAANLVTLGLLAGWARAEGFALRSFYRPDRARLRRDLPVATLVTVLGAALAAGANIALATALWGAPQTALDLFVGQLPTWAVLLAVVLFPVTTAATELPLYYGYVQPRLAARGIAGWAVVTLPAAFHALQHATLPLLFDARFLTWRALMFAPFALLLAWAFRRPTLLPYLVVVHLLLDLQAVLMVATAQG